MTSPIKVMAKPKREKASLKKLKPTLKKVSRKCVKRKQQPSHLNHAQKVPCTIGVTSEQSGWEARTNHAAARWDEQACDMINALSWQRIGCEQTMAADGHMVPDLSKPILRCQHCHMCSSASDLQPACHRDVCPVLAIISACPGGFRGGGDSADSGFERQDTCDTSAQNAPECTTAPPAPTPTLKPHSASEIKSLWEEFDFDATVIKSPNHIPMLLLTPRRTSSGALLAEVADLAKELDIIGDGSFLADF
jgi:hypothetical protein